ncbi:MAG: GAF domain-containing protein [Nitriliruptor sp.]|nr:MAG: GAF domain-containing protein [Nitriliruptor sp.]
MQYFTSPGGGGVAVGGTEPRILAVTDSASLVIGLTFSHRGWDVASQTPGVDASLDGDVVVFDLGTTSAGLEAAGQLQPPARALVIGDEEPSDAPPAGVQVLVRPYTVDELADRVDQLLSPAALERSTWVDPPGAEARRAESSAAGAWADGDLAEGARAAMSSTRTDDVDGVASGLGSADLAASGVDGVSVPEEPSTGVPGSSERGRRVDRSEPRRSLSSRLFGRVAEATSAGTESSEAPLATDAEPVAATENAGVSVDVDDELTVEVTPDDGGGAGLEQGFAAAAAPPPPPTPTPPPVAPAAAAATALLERRVIQVTAPASAAPPEVRPTRWRARGQKSGTASERQLRERLARVLAATSELERLTDEVPLLTDLTALATAVVREVGAQLDADTVGLWQAADQGWQVLAHTGLTRHEATWTVPFDQPLFSEVHATGGALLLDPVDAVQAAVAGIGGAHTESFMAAAIAAGPGRYGILAVGRDRPLVEADLDTLGDLALEMAPGLAVAEQLARLRGTGAPTDAPPAQAAGDGRPWRSGA